MRGAAASESAEGDAAEVPPRRSQAATEEAGESKAADAVGAAPRGGLVLCYGEVWEGGLAQLLESNDGGSEGGGGLCVRLSQGPRRPMPGDAAAGRAAGGRGRAAVACGRVAAAAARGRACRGEASLPPPRGLRGAGQHVHEHCKCTSTLQAWIYSSVIYTSLMFAPHEHINRTSSASRAARLGAGTALARFGGCGDARSAGRRLLGRQPAA